jgi:hypothetical protein
MTPHDHTAFVPGCYRCELGRDELARQHEEIEAEREAVIAAVMRHANALDHPEPGDIREYADIDNELYNAVRALDPVEWDQQVPGLALIPDEETA